MRVAIFIAVALIASPALCGAGTVKGRITNLFGKPRPSIKVDYEVVGKDQNNGRPYVIHRDSFTTSAGPGSDGGTFQFTFPDNKYLDNIQEVEVQLSSFRLTPVAVQSLLGTGSHSIEIVMPEQQPIRTRTIVEMPLATYSSPRGSFHLFSANGSGSYATRRAGGRLAKLARYRSDGAYTYYREGGSARVSWAFAHKPTMYCVWSECRYVVHNCGYAVWVASPIAGDWSFYDWMDRIVPSNLTEPMTIPDKNGTVSSGSAHGERSASQNARSRRGGHSRIWSSASGSYSVEAALVAIDPRLSRVVLATKVGRRVSVAIRLLAPADREYVADALRVLVMR